MAANSWFETAQARLLTMRASTAKCAAAVAEEVERLRGADGRRSRWQRGDWRGYGDRCRRDRICWRDRRRWRDRGQRRRAAPQFVNRRRDRLGSFAGLKQRTEDRLALVQRSGPERGPGRRGRWRNG